MNTSKMVGNGSTVVLEVNTVPGMGNGSTMVLTANTVPYIADDMILNMNSVPVMDETKTSVSTAALIGIKRTNGSAVDLNMKEVDAVSGTRNNTVKVPNNTVLKTNVKKKKKILGEDNIDFELL